jgi:hypothetical protein
MSIAISELTDGLNQLENQHQILHGNGGLPSPDHLVNRKDLLEKMGINPGVTTTTTANKQLRNSQPSSSRYNILIMEL